VVKNAILITDTLFIQLVIFATTSRNYLEDVDMIALGTGISLDAKNIVKIMVMHQNVAVTAIIMVMHQNVASTAIIMETLWHA
jgi:hypothetical protein